MLKLFTTIFMTGMMVSSLGYARYLYEDFEGYDDGQGTVNYYYDTDTLYETGQPLRGVNIIELAEFGAVKAAFFNLDSDNLSPSDWIFFETSNQIKDGPPVADWFEAHLAFVPNDDVSNANQDNPSLINEVWWYAFADTTGDGDEDTYIESQATAEDQAGSPLRGDYGMLQAYPRRYFQGDTWDVLDIDEDEWDVTTEVGISFLENLTRVGIQIQTLDFDIPEGHEDGYFTVFVDDFAVVPEPGMLTMLLAATGFMFLFRGRRGARQV